MAYSAKLLVTGRNTGENEFNVVTCKYNFRRDTDSRGMPTSGIKDGMIYLTLETSSLTGHFFSFLVNNEVITGKIRFAQSGSEQRLKLFSFTEARIVQFSEMMDSVGTQSMTTSITISASKIEMDQDSLSWAWGDTQS